MNAGEIISIVAVSLTGIGMVAAVGVLFSKLRRDLALLRQSIQHLAETVHALRTEGKHRGERVDDHEGRIIRLETQRETGGPGDRAAAST